MLDAPGFLWLLIFVPSYEGGKALVEWLWRRRSNTTSRPEGE